MTRPLRIVLPGARYHLSARGNERRDIFRDEADRRHFLELLADLPERFGARVHAYVLMPNHYHLLLETADANLSQLGQWLNVSYSVWFNRRHRRSGHLFQGRFGAILIEEDRAFQEVGRYLHLNPVRVMRLGLGKAHRSAAKLGLAPAPSPEVLKERLALLRQWRWSSYRAYAGYAPVPPWLTVRVLGAMCGGRTDKERRGRKSSMGGNWGNQGHISIIDNWALSGQGFGHDPALADCAARCSLSFGRPGQRTA